MSKCELCIARYNNDRSKANKAEYIMKMKNISNEGIVNANYVFRVCKECYNEHNPDGLKRTEMSPEEMPLDDIDNISPRLRKAKVRDPFIHDFIVSDIKRVVSDGIIIHWRKIRR